jgi:hypothetical protein
LPRDGFGLAILSNRHVTKLNQALSNSLVDHLLDLPRREWNAYFQKLGRREDEVKHDARRARDALRRPDQPPSKPLGDYAGDYDHPAYGRAHVSIEGMSLQWSWSTFRGGLTHHHADVFELKNEYLDDPLIEFRLDEMGRVTGFVFLNLNFQKV